MGPTRLLLDKPVIAAVEGFAVAGGLELACWADLRVAAADATFGVYCRRWGVPLIDGGTIRLPRLIGQSRALDLILTGRGIDGVEAERIGLVNRVVPTGEALAAAIAVGRARSPRCRRSACAPIALGATTSAATVPRRRARRTRSTSVSPPSPSGETADGARRFASGAGRHGRPA